MSKQNFLARTINKLNSLPLPMRRIAISKMFGTAVKFFGTAGISVQEINPNKSVMIMKNRKKVQNHIGTVHAAAMSLLAESSTGMLVGLSVPDDKLPLMKNMSFQYVKRAAPGQLTAVATLTDEQLEMIRTEDKGEVNVKVVVTDVKGVEPVICDLVWAWVPKKRN